VARSLDEIAQELAHDARPSNLDGCSNVDRIKYIVEVLEVERIDLTIDFDLSELFDNKEYDEVQAIKHFIMLKMDFLNRQLDHYHITPDQHRLSVAPLVLDIQRLNWHMEHLVEGRPTPPYPFL
jgi:hypothetical protein